MEVSSHPNHQEHFDRSKIRYISFLSLLFGFTDAFFTYIVSTYFAEVIGSDNVGAFYLVTFAAVFLLLWHLHGIVRRFGGSVRSFLLLITLGIATSSLLSILPVGWIGAGLMALLLVLVNMAWVTLDVVLEEFSADNVTGRVRGLHLTIMNIGFLVAPFLSTRVIGDFGFGGVFFGVTLGLSLLLVFALIILRNGKQYASAKMKAGESWKKMLREKNLFHIYNISFGLEFFYVAMIIYTPIHLRSIGISWDDIGILFTVMLLPFVLLQYPLGLLADKRFGEKEFLAVSVVLSGIAVVLMGAYSSDSLLVWGAILFLSRVGAAGMEVLRDAYFYKQIDGDDDDLIAFFRTARPLANIAAAIVAVLLLSIFPLQSMFFFVAIVFCGTLFSVMMIEDTPSEADIRIA